MTTENRLKQQAKMLYGPSYTDKASLIINKLLNLMAPAAIEEDKIRKEKEEAERKERAEKENELKRKREEEERIKREEERVKREEEEKNRAEAAAQLALESDNQPEPGPSDRIMIRVFGAPVDITGLFFLILRNRY